MNADREPSVYDLVEPIMTGAVGPDALVYRVVDVRGFSSRFTSDLAVRDGAELLGAVLGGLADDQLADAQPGIVTVGVGDAEAAIAGLSCGGQARVLVQPLADVPAEFWSLLQRREPALLLTRLTGDSVGATEVFDEPGVTDLDVEHAGVAKVFGRGSTASTVLADDELAAAYWPQPRLVVIGAGGLADALTTLAEQLGWAAHVQTEPRELDALGPADAVVILSHDRTVDVPALAQCLAGRVGYIGGLGSRRTQDNRRAALAEIGLDPGKRIYGPAGLDIGAFAPMEVAVSIVAEIMAVRAGTDASSISARPGPVHS